MNNFWREIGVPLIRKASASILVAVLISCSNLNMELARASNFPGKSARPNFYRVLGVKPRTVSSKMGLEFIPTSQTIKTRVSRQVALNLVRGNYFPSNGRVPVLTMFKSQALVLKTNGPLGAFQGRTISLWIVVMKANETLDTWLLTAIKGPTAWDAVIFNADTRKFFGVASGTTRLNFN